MTQQAQKLSGTEDDNNTKYALITGGSSGIGKELAKLFAEERYNLVIVARGKTALHAIKSELEEAHGIHVITIAKDLAEANAAFELYQEIRDQQVFIDVLVNDAGQGEYGLFVEADLDRLQEIIRLNIISLTTLTYLFLKDMVARNRGMILQLGSIASETPGPWQAVYHATKAYVLSLSEGVRHEIKDTDVTITVLEPGATDTDFFNKAGMQNSKILDGKLSDPAEVAKDGFDGLMRGKDKVISGLKNKLLVAMSKILPDNMAAAQMEKNQEPKDRS